MLDIGFTSWPSGRITLPETLAALATADCKSVEVAGEAAYLENPERVKREILRYGLTVTTVSTGVPFSRDPSLNLNAGDQKRRAKSVEYVCRCIDLASFLEAKIVYVCSVSKDPQSGGVNLDPFAQSLRSCAEYGEGRGVVVAVEPFPTGELCSAKEAGSLIRAIDMKSLGLLIDTGHLAISREPLAETARTSKDVLVHVHLDNNDGVTDLHWPPQRGVLTRGDFRGLLAELETGYGGRCSVELSEPDSIADAVSECRSYFDSLTV